MNRGQFRDDTLNLPGYKRIYFKWTMTAATTFTINRAQEFRAGTVGGATGSVNRTGVGVYDLFPQDAPGVELIDWWADAIEAAPTNTTANSGKATIANALVASSKVTITFRRNSDQAATDFANTDIIYGYLGIQTVYAP